MFHTELTEEGGNTFYDKCTFPLSLTVFEILKRKGFLRRLDAIGGRVCTYLLFTQFAVLYHIKQS
jgi:hypothetical protein